MFEVLVREAAARFGLGDKALQVVQLLLAYMTSRDRGGVFGFLEKFKAAGLGPIIQSWLGGGPSAQPISNSQLETVLGSSGGLLSLITERTGLERDNVTSALGYLLPAIVGRLTPGGSIASTLPPDVLELAQAGEQLLAAPAAVAPAAGGGGALTRWLPWLIVALAVVFGLTFLGRNRGSEEPAPPAAAPTQPEAAQPEATPPPATPTEAAPAETAPESAPAPAAEPAAAPADAAAAQPGAAEPSGPAVHALQLDERPALDVFFDSGKTDVAPEFADRAGELVAYLGAHPDARAVIAGFNDPTGDAAANAELSKQRAQAVQAALVALGVDVARTELEKPADATDATAGYAASRRVEVRLRP